MPRQAPLDREELTAHSIRLRAEQGLHAYGATAKQVLDEVFGAERAFFYCFFDGRLNMPPGAHNIPDAEQTIPEYEKMLESVRVFDPLDVKRRGKLVHHSTEVYQWYHGKPRMAEEAYFRVFHRMGLDWMLTAHFFEGELFLGSVGVGQSVAAGDFSPHDAQALQMLYVHFEAGLLAACRMERLTRFGAGLGAAIENYPEPLFVFERSGKLVYANHQARLAVQSEETEGSKVPLATCSTMVRSITPRLGSAAPARFALADGTPVQVQPLGDWPRLGLHGLSLVMLNPKPPGRGPLSEREHGVVMAMAGSATAAAGARRLGISVHTLNTHLKNAYRKLGVSALSEALVSLCLGGGQENGHHPQ